MPAEHIEATLRVTRADGATDPELSSLRRRLDQLADPGAGMLPGESLTPLPDLPRLAELPEPEDPRDLLDRVAVVKVNGGLGTSMGLTAPKSLLQVKPGNSFLDVLAAQVLGVRERHGTRLPLLLMNSRTTREPSLAALDAYPALAQQDSLPRDFLQGREPKLRADDQMPVQWPADPSLEWCPPGHGDLYTALAASGTLEALLDAGVRWLFASNADNLGAVVDARIPAWMAATHAPFVMEAVRGTAADRKGGHLALRDGQVVLRETAQVPKGDATFTDVDRWRYYNSNNLWIDLEALRALQVEQPGGPDLPLIVNRKTVDPRDPDSTPVLQLETAMGAAIGEIPGARALEVPRTRFAPVKTTDDLLVVRSDAYELTGDGRMEPTFTGPGPVVTLDREHYKQLPDLERHFPRGAPGLRSARSLRVDGPVTFGAGVQIEGDVHLTGPMTVPDGEVLS
ncbi:UTP--glucose-1-phosphate uridylyltransferase [Janibacter corallicola]|uniref:UTP--glucose-1-phosphate uridylyltransferase n=1 Tax=Janibacter corallicola TaxID=415212 RepID=UPI00082A3B16|nr:UTP--glucose-1-phosphate uridylyltransferase [Janibacter corallicola]